MTTTPTSTPVTATPTHDDGDGATATDDSDGDTDDDEEDNGADVANRINRLPIDQTEKNKHLRTSVMSMSIDGAEVFIAWESQQKN